VIIVEIIIMVEWVMFFGIIKVFKIIIIIIIIIIIVISIVVIAVVIKVVYLRLWVFIFLPMILQIEN